MLHWALLSRHLVGLLLPWAIRFTLTNFRSPSNSELELRQINLLTPLPCFASVGLRFYSHALQATTAPKLDKSAKQN
ncbi:hypothetical protein F4860DRAFT_484472 [Xylaria cubensis]|nr:hypothetical protein F4860DRAFT_484472 [Xylaria cubensis]